MKFITRIMAMPLGAIVGTVVWLLMYISIFDSIEILPLDALALKLAPGTLGGAALAYFYPQLFLWFLDVEIH